jgi:peptidoglycan/LPS O-acetylase OafA/YrhL
MWMATACALWRITAQQNFPSIAGSAYAQFRTDYRLDTLLWGCVMAFVLRESGGHLKRWLNAWSCGLVLAAYAACLLFYSGLTRIWMPMLIPLLLAGTLTHPEWRFSRLLELAPVRWIGKLSYSLYLWQMLFLVDTVASPHWWQQTPVNIALAFLAAAASYYLIETRAQRFGRKLAERAGAARPPVPAERVAPA